MGNAWDANMGKYRWSLNGDGSISCAANPDQHKRDLCECDARYAMELGKVWDDATYDYTLWNAKKNSAFNFDFENVCVRSGLTDADECCGAYPERYPFDSARGCAARELPPTTTSLTSAAMTARSCQSEVASLVGCDLFVIPALNLQKF